jgi:hypothetical protein
MVPRDQAAGPLGVYERNARHGQNRAGIELGSDESFEEFESALPVDPRAADERLADEGPEIQARKHEKGHDVLDPAETGGETRQ